MVACGARRRRHRSTLSAVTFKAFRNSLRYHQMVIACIEKKAVRWDASGNAVLSAAGVDEFVHGLEVWAAAEDEDVDEEDDDDDEDDDDEDEDFDDEEFDDEDLDD